MKAFWEWLKGLFAAKKEEKIVETPVFDNKVVANPVVPKVPVDINVFLKSLTHFEPSQKDGYQRITNKFYELGYSDLRWLAYMLATALHETAHTMRPVKEYGGEEYLKSKKYYPYVGRGYVQLTWDYNYLKYGILEDPDKALEPDFASFVLIDGMVKGTFTGRKLSEFFNVNVEDPMNARRVVNWIDQAELIATYYKNILTALNKARIL